MPFPTFSRIDSPRLTLRAVEAPDLPDLLLGYALGRSHWGQGLMREAVRTACAQTFYALGIRRIEAEVNPDNLASCALLIEVGFTLEGTLRKRWVAKGAAYDTNIYGCLAEDWRSRTTRTDAHRSFA